MIPPTWLVDAAELRLWAEMSKRLERRGLLAGVDPEMLAAYCYCMAKALSCARVDPKRIDWMGSHAGSMPHPRWVGYPHRSGENPLVYLWRRGAEFAGNGLGLWKPRHISLMELLLYDTWDELDDRGELVYRHAGEVIFRLNLAWQYGED